MAVPLTIHGLDGQLHTILPGDPNYAGALAAAQYATAVNQQPFNPPPEAYPYLSALNQLKQQYDLQDNQITSQEQALAANRTRQEAIANSNTNTALANLATAGTNARTNISGQLESRGLYGSGEAEHQLALQRQKEGEQQGSIQTGNANAISNIEAQLAQQQRDLEAQRATARLQYQQKGLTV